MLIATHIDAEHIHSHFIVNAVCLDSGKMLRQGPGTLARLRPISDEICQEHGLSVLQKDRQKESQGVSTREYRSAVKGESWKYLLMNTIDDCMRCAASREDFISLMKSEGYDVRWEESRKSITYTTPTGMKCRDNKLHDSKYLKTSMQLEFDYREHKTVQDTATGWEVQRSVFLAGKMQSAPQQQAPMSRKSRVLVDEVLYQADRLARGLDYDDEMETLAALASLTALSIAGVVLLLETIADADTETMTDKTLNAYIQDLQQEPENNIDYEPEQGFSMTMM